MVKSRVVIGEKRINERASFVCNLQAARKFFVSMRTGLEVLIKVTYKNRFLQKKKISKKFFRFK